jgi:hypothetical protein
MSFLSFPAPDPLNSGCTDVTELDFEFQTVCHRTSQAEKRLARQQALVAMLSAKGQPTGEIQATLNVANATLLDLRTQRSDIARKLRYRARKSQPR